MCRVLSFVFERVSPDSPLIGGFATPQIGGSFTCLWSALVEDTSVCDVPEMLKKAVEEEVGQELLWDTKPTSRNRFYAGTLIPKRIPKLLPAVNPTE